MLPVLLMAYTTDIQTLFYTSKDANSRAFIPYSDPDLGILSEYGFWDPFDTS